MEAHAASGRLQQHDMTTSHHCTAHPTESKPALEASHHAVSCKEGMQVGIQGVRMGAIQVAMGVHDFHLQIKGLSLVDTQDCSTWIEESLMGLP